MTTRQIRVVPYDPSWPVKFEAIRIEIETALGDLAVAVHHVGSTSVSGMSAKPVIDLDVEIESRSVFLRYVTGSMRQVICTKGIWASGTERPFATRERSICRSITCMFVPLIPGNCTGI